MFIPGLANTPNWPSHVTLQPNLKPLPKVLSNVLRAWGEECSNLFLNNGISFRYKRAYILQASFKIGKFSKVLLTERSLYR
ncbi:hypothetical protein FRX31_017213, partial [Thalictrum thalictroides]